LNSRGEITRIMQMKNEVRRLHQYMEFTNELHKSYNKTRKKIIKFHVCTSRQSIRNIISNLLSVIMKHSLCIGLKSYNKNLFQSFNGKMRSFLY
jgi:hypothetical protein